MSNLTLFDLTYKVARHLGVVIEGTATGGSTTTIVDNPKRNEENNYWRYGSAWIVYDAGGAGAAPQGEFARISSSTSSTYTITLDAALTAAVASGDRYALTRRFGGTTAWLDIIIQHINDALAEIGPIPLSDTTSITTSGSQTEYSLPIAANQDVREVWLQTLQDTNNNEWARIYDYVIQPNDRGSSDLLIFGKLPAAGYSIKIVYLAPHPQLFIASDQLNEHVPENLVVYPAVRDCFLHLKNYSGDTKWDAQIQYWSQRADMAKSREHIQKPHRPGRVLAVRRTTTNYPGDQTVID